MWKRNEWQKVAKKQADRVKWIQKDDKLEPIPSYGGKK